MSHKVGDHLIAKIVGVRETPIGKYFEVKIGGKVFTIWEDEMQENDFDKVEVCEERDIYED